MPGMHAVISDLPLGDIADRLSDTCLEPNYRIAPIHRTETSGLFVSGYEGYPYSTWVHDNAVILLDGMVYNYSPSELQSVLNAIAGRLNRREDYHALVSAFVDRADGDFNVFIATNDDRYLIFNDYLGRLPLYHYIDNRICIVSREMKAVLSLSPEIRFDRAGIVEFLMLEHALGDRTIFDNVRRLQPARAMTLERRRGVELVSNTPSVDFNCVLSSPFRSVAQSLPVMRDGFMESVDNRVRSIGNSDYSIIADLSGGYDSRTVLAGLQKYTRDVTYLSVNLSTNAPGHDETDWAEKVFRRFGSPGELRKIHARYEYEIQQLGPLVYKTDGMVNYLSTFVCYRDLAEMKALVSFKAARMPGLGGSDFLRKAPQLFLRSIENGIRRGYYLRTSIGHASVCALARLAPDDYLAHVEQYERSYPEKTPGDKLKRFYFDYQNHFAWGAPEDRERIHFWTAPPMCGMAFLRTILNCFPNEWSSQDYFVRFMKEIDPRLLEVPLYGDDIDLRSTFALRKRAYLKRVLERIEASGVVSPLQVRALVRWIRGRKPAPAMPLEIIRQLGEKLGPTGEIIRWKDALDCLTSKPDASLHSRIVTLYLYLGEIEQRFQGKIVIR